MRQSSATGKRIENSLFPQNYSYQPIPVSSHPPYNWQAPQVQPGIIRGTSYMHPDAGLNSYGPTRITSVPATYQNNFVGEYVPQAPNRSSYTTAPRIASATYANVVPATSQPIYRRQGDDNGYYNQATFEPSVIHQQMDQTALSRKLMGEQPIPKITIIGGENSRREQNEVQLDKIRVFKKANVEKMFGRDVAFDCNYEPLKLFSTKDLRGFLINGFSDFEHNLRKLESSFTGIEQSFFHLMHKTESPKDMFDRFLVALDRRVEKFFTAFDEAVIQNRGQGSVSFDTSVLRNDYEFWNFRSAVKQGIVEVSNKLNDLFLSRDNSSYYDAQVIKSLETIIRLYGFLKSDFNTVLHKSLLRYGKILEACTYNYDDGEGIKALNFADYIQLDIASLVASFSDEFDRTYPVLLSKKQIAAEKFHEILKDKSPLNQFDLKQLVRSVYSRERRKVYRTVYNVIAQSGKNNFELSENLLSQNKGITERMNRIKQQFLSIKSDPLYLEVMSGRTNLEALKNSPTLFEENSQGVLLLESLMVNTQELIDDIKNTLQDIIYYKEEESNHYKELFSDLLSKATFSLGAQEKQIQEKGDMSEFLLQQFKQLENTLYSDHNRQSAEASLDSTMIQQLKKNSGNVNLSSIAADMAKTLKEDTKKKEALKENQAKKAKEFQSQISNFLTGPMIDKARGKYDVVEDDYDSHGKSKDFKDGIKGIADKLLDTIKKRREEELEKDRKLREEQEEIRILKEIQTREENERIQQERQRQLESQDKRYKEIEEQRKIEQERRLQQRYQEQQEAKEKEEQRNRQDREKKDNLKRDEELKKQQKEDQKRLEDEKRRKKQEEEYERQKKKEDEERDRIRREDDRKREDERKKLDLEERKKRDEEDKKKRDEDARIKKEQDDKKRKEDEAIRKKEDEDRKKKKEEEDKKKDEERKKKDEEDKKKREELEEKRKKEDEERKKKDEERKKKQKEEEDKRLKELEEQRKKKEEDDKNRKEEEDRKRKLKEEEDKRQKESEDQRKKKDEEDRKKKQKEDDDRRKKEDEDRKKREDEDRKKKQQEDDDRRKKQDEEKKRKYQEEEDKKKKLQEEEDKKKKQKEEDDRKKKQKEEEDRKKKEEDDKKKKLKDEEDKRLKELEEQRRKKEEEDKKKSNNNKKESGFTYEYDEDFDQEVQEELYEDIQEESLGKQKSKAVMPQSKKNNDYDFDDLENDDIDYQPSTKTNVATKQQTSTPATGKAANNHNTSKKSVNEYDDDFEIEELEDSHQKGDKLSGKKSNEGFDFDDEIEGLMADKKDSNKKDDKNKNKSAKDNKPDKKTSQFDYNFDDDEDIEEDLDIPKTVNDGKKDNKDKKVDNKVHDDEYNLDDEDDDLNNFGDEPGDQQLSEEQMQQILLQRQAQAEAEEEENFHFTYEMIAKTNEYVKKTKLAKQPVNLSKFNSYDYINRIFEEFIANQQAFLFDFAEGDQLVELFEQFQENPDETEPIIEDYVGQIQKLYADSTQLTSFHPETKLYFPLQSNRFGFQLIEVSVAAHRISYFYMIQENDEETLNQLREFHEFFIQLLGFDGFEAAPSIVQDATLKVLQVYEKEPHLQYMIMAFPLIYEFMSDLSDINVEQNTLNRIFYIQVAMEGFYEELEKNQEKVQNYFMKLLSGYENHDEILVSQIKYEEFSEEVLSTLPQQLAEVKAEVLDSDKRCAIVLIEISTYAEQPPSPLYFYFEKSADPSTAPHQIGLFCLAITNQINEHILEAIEQGLVDEECQFTPQQENTRHNGLYEYSDFSLGIWAHMVDKKKIPPQVAINIINFSLIPYHITYKGLD